MLVCKATEELQAVLNFVVHAAVDLILIQLDGRSHHAVESTIRRRREDVGRWIPYRCERRVERVKPVRTDHIHYAIAGEALARVNRVPARVCARLCGGGRV